MLSICIPVYNKDVSVLINALFNQSQMVNSDIEILVIDDASISEFQEINNTNCIGKAKYVQLKENIGRARIRNLFLQYASQLYLVFLDCDVEIPDSDFVKRYFEYAQNQSPMLVAGGHYYDKTKPDKDKLLRWKFGVYRESPNAEQRNVNPYKSFKTSNFMVSRKLFEETRFDESIKGYGHEDTLFGYEIKKQGVVIQHIENPVFIPELDSNKEFISKTKRSIENLVNILVKVNYDQNLINDITLLKAYYYFRRKRLIWIVKMMFVVFSGLINQKLMNGRASLRMFDFYKLAYLIKVMQK